ncbi:MAG: TfoX/Sxy family protein [Sneathiella sp.]|uniref:TfoX/Sxy family protein n=1 Tax=Sneathiella sp. TaxID=1964365 RepID=UPI003001A331
MAEPYYSALQHLAETNKLLTSRSQDLSCKHFFSGAAAYIDKHIFLSISPVGLALKLSDEDCTALFELGGTQLRYFPKAPVKKGYVVLTENIVEDEEDLNSWIMRSIAFIEAG